MILEKTIEGPVGPGLLIDIETTGLSAKYCKISSIGLLGDFDGSPKFLFLFAEDKDKEKNLLEDFLEISEKFDSFISFNGLFFDLPFILKRLEANVLNGDKIKEKNHFDLYQHLKKYSKITGIEASGLKTLEKENGLIRPFEMTGKDQIDLYKSYLKENDEEILERLFTYNFFDLYYLKSLLFLKEEVDEKRRLGNFLIEGYKEKKDSLIVSLKALDEKRGLECNFSYPLCSFYSKEGEEFFIEIKVTKGLIDPETEGLVVDNSFFKVSNKSSYTRLKDDLLPVKAGKDYLNENLHPLIKRVIELSFTM